MIAGEWRVVDGQPVGLDLAALIAEHQAGRAGFRLNGADARSAQHTGAGTRCFPFRPPRE